MLKAILDIRVAWNTERGFLTPPVITLHRPDTAALLTACPPLRLPETLFRVHTLCGHAQACAGILALKALGFDHEPPPSSALWAEFLHERFWRLCLDWPRALGHAPHTQAFARWRAARNTPQLSAETHRLAELLALHHEKTLAALPARDPAAPTPQGPLPADSIRTAYARNWQGLHAAIDAFTQNRPYPTACTHTLCDGSQHVHAHVLTSRGTLTHHLVAQERRLCHYRIWAPTDMHFANPNALTRLLEGQGRVQNAEKAKQILNWAVLALDPCVPYTLELTDA
jgi:uptake hydrogenase large subunit